MNSGVRGGLWDAKHYLAMRDAVFLFGWLVHRQTTQKLGEGLVLRGKPISYAEIVEQTGFKERTLKRWMGLLVRRGYISVKYTCYCKMIIRILNAKKFSQQQMDLPMSAAPAESRRRVARTKKISSEFPQRCRPDVAHISTKVGPLKERAEIEQKKQKRTTGADAPGSFPKDFQANNEGQQQYAQTGQLATEGEKLLGSGAPMTLPDLVEDLKRLAAARSIPDYGPKVARAVNIAVRRFEGARRTNAGKPGIEFCNDQSGLRSLTRREMGLRKGQ